MREHLIDYGQIAELSDRYGELLRSKSSETQVKEFLSDNFKHILEEANGFYKRDANVSFDKLWPELDEEERRELARPLSARQMYAIECVINPINKEYLWGLWDFLDDYGRIRNKKYMSSAEIGAFVVMLEFIVTRISGQFRNTGL